MELCSLLSEMSLKERHHEHFMAVACLAAQRSKDPCTQVGACIADRKGNMLSSGYNGMPRGCHDDEFPWGKENSDPLKNKHLYVCHAELNAIANSMGAVEDCIIYVTLFPCNECAKLIIQHGITEVVYLSDKHATKSGTIAAKLMFDSARIKYWQFKSKKKIVVDLDNRKEIALRNVSRDNLL